MAPVAKKKVKAAHVFIDTSAFLRFFSFTGDDIDQLGKLKAAINDGRLILHVPRQVVDEFNRNRENKIKEALDGFKRSDLKSLPRLLANYADAKSYQQAVQAVQEARDALLSAAQKDAEAKELAADKLFVDLCERAGVYEVTDGILARAIRRHQLGNPPGKAESPPGDRIIWETLLAKVPKDADLHVVSKDGHFASPLAGNARPLRFLADEWLEKKNARIHLHAEVRIFFKTLLKLEFESLKQEKTSAVESLVNSYNFAATHSAVAQLQLLIDLLDASDVAALAEAAIENTQVNWIAQDDDVREFYIKLLPKHLGTLDPMLRSEVMKLFGIPADREGGEGDGGGGLEDIPF